MSVSHLERLKLIPNGEKEQLTFSDAEMERRLSVLRKIMADDGLDVALLTSYHNVKYFSDFLYTSFGRPYAFVVTADDHFTVSANIDAGMPWRRTFGNNVVYTDWHRDNYIWVIRESLRTRGLTLTRVGVEDDTLPLEMRGKFQAAFPDATLVDVSAAAMQAAHAEVGRGDRGHQARHPHRRPRRRRRARRHHRRGPGVRGRPGRDPGHGPRDRPHLPARRDQGHLGLVPVRHQHRRGAQLADHTPGAARRHPVA